MPGLDDRSIGDSAGVDALWGHLPAVSAEELWWRLRDRPGDPRVLVAGCGYGRHVAYFARHGFDTTGIDVSRQAIELAHEAARVAGLEVALSCASATRMPFPTAAFDAVYDHALLHHLDARDRVTAVAEYRRALRPGGLLVVSVLAEVEDPCQAGTAPTSDGCIASDDECARYEHHFRPDELADLLDGFAVDSVISLTETDDEWSAQRRGYVRAVARRMTDVEFARVLRERLPRIDRVWGSRWSARVRSGSGAASRTARSA